MRHTALPLACALLGACVPSHVAAPLGAHAPKTRATVFAQLPVADHLVGRGFFSHAKLGRARNHVRADDFVLSHPVAVTGVRWWGQAEQEGAGLENFTRFTVTVLEDRGGQPGGVVFTETFRTPQTHSSPTGRRAPPHPERGLGEEHVQWVRFRHAVALQSGAIYYLSIAAHRADPDGTTWQWADGETTNAVGFSHPIDQAAWDRIVDVDSAFELEGTIRG